MLIASTLSFPVDERRGVLILNIILIKVSSYNINLVNFMYLQIKYLIILLVLKINFKYGIEFFVLQRKKKDKL